MISEVQLERSTFAVEPAEAGQRLDAFLVSRRPDLSRARLQRLIDQGHVVVEGHPVKRSYRLRPGDKVALSIPPPEPSHVVPQALPLTIVYEDADLLVVDKSSGMTVHPAPGHPLGTLVNALLAYCPDLTGIGGELRPGIVHRLDKDTSGLLVVAKNDLAHRKLQAQFKARTVRKVYQALVWGHPQPDSETVEGPIARDPRHRQRMALVPGGRSAITAYRTLRSYPQMTLLEVMPQSGRTHQIRVHLTSRGHPIVGDRLYSRRSSPLPRHFLHAHLLGFHLPTSERYVEFTSPLPSDLDQFLQALEEEQASSLLP